MRRRLARQLRRESVVLALSWQQKPATKVNRRRLKPELQRRRECAPPGLEIRT